MAEWDYIIIGAGPAGATLAWTLGKQGFRVLVAEAANKPGMKPCGRGIPDTEDLPYSVPGECIRENIRAAELYVDGEKAFYIEGVQGKIVDRTCLTSHLLAEAGAETLYRAHYKKTRNMIRHGGRYIEALPEKTIIAAGYPFYPGEKISALQYIIPGEWPSKLTILFDTHLIGYYWLFPAGPGKVEVGVGGYADMATLKELLDRFIEKSGFTKELRKRAPIKREGARIAVGGVIKTLLQDWPIHIGEAAGFVYPLTGEGIRPSIVSAYKLGKLLSQRKNPASLLREEPAKGISLQRMILEKVKAMKPRERAELLHSIPDRLHMKVALGKATKLDLAKALARKPWLLFRLGLR